MFGNFDIDCLIFGILPCAVLAIALIGTIARYERDPYTWKASSSQLLRRKQLIWGSVLFHVGIIVLFFGHLIGLFTPIWLLDALGISYGLKQWMAVIIGGAAAFVGCSMLLHRRLSDPRIRNNSSFADISILAILWLQIVVGIGTIVLTLGHVDGSKMIQFMTWSQSVMGLQINAWTEVVDVHWLYKFHIFPGMVIVALFPFTRLVNMLSILLRYLWRPGNQIVRSPRGARPVRKGLTPYKAPAERKQPQPPPASIRRSDEHGTAFRHHRQRPAHPGRPDRPDRPDRHRGAEPPRAEGQARPCLAGRRPGVGAARAPVAKSPCHRSAVPVPRGRAGLALARPFGGTETLPLGAATGRITAAAVRSPLPLPPFDKAAMDGYGLDTAALTNTGPRRAYTPRRRGSGHGRRIPARGPRPWRAKRARVAILSIGSELVGPDQPLAPGPDQERQPRATGRRAGAALRRISIDSTSRR